MTSWQFRFVFLCTASLTAGCTSSAGDPLEPLPHSGGEVVLGEYATETKGTQAGAVIANHAFDGYVDAQLGVGPEHVREIKLSDFYNPTGDGVFGEDSIREAGTFKPRALLINVGAMSCGPCQEEAQGLLPRLYRELGPERLEILTVLLEGQATGAPATFDDLDVWCTSFNVGYPAVIDPAAQLADVIDTAAFPGNVVIDTETMTIVEVSTGLPGDEGYVEDRLRDVLER